MRDREVGVGRFAVTDLGPRLRRQLEMAREEVRVEVGLDDLLYGQTGLVGVGEVRVDVALRVDHDGAAGALVADEVRRMRQAPEEVLAEEHADDCAA